VGLLRRRRLGVLIIILLLMFLCGIDKSKSRDLMTKKEKHTVAVGRYYVSAPSRNGDFFGGRRGCM
jgi:hypothetical protein